MGIYLGDKEVTMVYLGDLPISTGIVLNPSEGSILYLDATNVNSYPGSGNIWYDLSGFGNHATLYGAISESFQSPGYFEFSGSADSYGEVLQSATLNLFASQIDFTMIVISQYDGPSIGDYRVGLIAKDSATSNPGFALGVGYADAIPDPNFPKPAGIFYESYFNSGSLLRSSQEDFGTDFVVTTVKRDASISDNIIMYINKGQGPNIVDTDLYNNTNNLIIGKWGIDENYFEGKLTLVALYHRALTKTEIDNIVDYYDTILPIL
jgi:hypothetical protein